METMILSGFASDGPESYALLVDYSDVFLSAVWTLVLTTPNHCRGSIKQVM